MNNQEAIKILTAKAECIRRDTSRIDVDCNSRNCDNCELCYAQGTTGEQQEALTMAISAIEKQDATNTNMTREEMIEIEEDRRKMSAKEAIELIDNRMCFGRGKWSKHHMPVRDIYYMAGEMAIKALKAESCDDTISRQAALNSPVTMVSDGLDWIPAYHIKGLPSAQPEPQWIPVSESKPIAWMPMPDPYKEGNK